MSIINKEELKEKAKEVAINIGNDLKEANSTSKTLIIVLLILFILSFSTAYRLYRTDAEIKTLKTENLMIKNRMKDLDREVKQNKMEFLEIANRVDKINTNLETKLKEAKEVVIDEVKTSSDIISVLDGLSDLTTGK
jgi:Tfp pilus assembly protein PilO